jgi:hypothetical protein
MEVWYPLDYLQKSRFYLPFQVAAIVGVSLNVLLTLVGHDWIGPLLWDHLC